MAELLLPAFSALSAKSFSAGFLREPGLLTAGLGLGLLTGIIAGSYPVFVLSSAPPALVLKGTVGESRGGRPCATGCRCPIRRFDRLSDRDSCHRPADALRPNDGPGIGQGARDRPARPGRIGPGPDRNPGGERQPPPRASLRRPPRRFVRARFWRQNYWREGMGANEYPTIALAGRRRGFLRDIGHRKELCARNAHPIAAPPYLLNEAAVRELGWVSPEAAVRQAFKIVDKGTIIGVVKDFGSELPSQKRRTAGPLHLQARFGKPLCPAPTGLDRRDLEHAGRLPGDGSPPGTRIYLPRSSTTST